jgi:hypothetical protein
MTNQPELLAGSLDSVADSSDCTLCWTDSLPRATGLGHCVQPAYHLLDPLASYSAIHGTFLHLETKAHCQR